MIKSHIYVLKKNKLFDGIDASELEAMLKCLVFKVSEYNKNEYIAFAGEKFDSVGIVVEGSAAVIKEDSEGNCVIMALLKPGDMFGEMAAFSSRPIWPANVHAQEKCMICFISTAKIVSACSNACRWHTVLIRNFLRTLSEKALMLNRKVEYLMIKSMRGRICAFLLEQYQRTETTTLRLSMNRNELADFLNVSRPSMSRELSKMKEEGLIDFHKETFKLINVEALKTCSGR